VPTSSAAGWADEEVIDGAGDLVADSLGYGTQTRRWLPELPVRQLAIGLFACLVLLAVLSIVLVGRVFGVTG
jgi:hypothetical protein